jgi:hypothetical protein
MGQYGSPTTVRDIWQSGIIPSDLLQNIAGIKALCEEAVRS